MAIGFIDLEQEYDIFLSYTSPNAAWSKIRVVFFVSVGCHRTVGVDFLQEFDVHIFYPLFLKRGKYCLSLHWVEGFLLVDECEPFDFGYR